MGQSKAICLVLAFGITFGAESLTSAQADANNSTVLERCVEYSNAGDLLEASGNPAIVQYSALSSERATY
jgi:hypothetical protein